MVGRELLLCASPLWGTTGTAQALAHLHVAPAVLGAARLDAGAVTLLTVCLVTGRGHALVQAFSARLRWWTISAGVATAIYQVSFFSAVAKTGVALGTVATLGSAPVFCGLLARVLLGEGMRASWAIATALAVAGCALLLLPVGASASPTGVLLALAAGACYGMYTVSARALVQAGAGTVALLAATLIAGARLLAPVLAGGAGALVSGRGALLVGWLGPVATAVAYVIFARGLAGVPAGMAATLGLAEPLAAAILGGGLLGEHLSASAGLGGGLLVLGLAGSVLRLSRAEPALVPEAGRKAVELGAAN